MRHADYVHSDTKGVLEKRHSAMIDKITQAIEKACAEGKFRAYCSFDKVLDSDTQRYLKDQLTALEYKVTITSYQRDGTNMEISW